MGNDGPRSYEVQTVDLGASQPWTGYTAYLRAHLLWYVKVIQTVSTADLLNHPSQPPTPRELPVELWGEEIY